jgi:hypothetical protein
MKTLLSLVLFATLLHADPETPYASQPQTPMPDSEQQPSQDMPDTSQQQAPMPNSSGSEQPSQDLPDTMQPAPSSSQDMPQSDPEMADSMPAMTDPVEPVEQCEPVCCEPYDPYGSFILNEFKMGYFRFGDKTLRHIYGKGILDIQLTSSFRFWKPLYAYVAFEYISAHGRTLGGHEETFVQVVPISLGVQYIQPITFDLKYYLTAGPRIYYFHQRNNSPGFPSSVNKWGCGGFINTGFIYYLSEHITFDFFGEYSYARMHFETHRPHVKGNTPQIGGMTLGAGIGYFW